MSDAIIVENLGKRFRRYHADRPATLKAAVLHGLRRMKPVEEFWALRDVSFRIAPGRMVGVIGRNGAGKSTLLRLIASVGRPDEGTVRVRGRLGAFLELAAGFRPDLSGRENVFVGGVIGGLTRREVSQRFDSIVSFAELQEFIDSPLRTYSTGMRMRLAFGIAVHTDPQVLLIDEVLAVGDLAFRSKCYDRIEQFKADGCTILLVSHDVHRIQRLCDEALWLRDGRLVAHDDPETVVGQYTTEMRTETLRRTPSQRPERHASTDAKLRLGENRFGSLELEIVDVRLLGAEGALVTEITSGDPLCIDIGYSAPQPIQAPIFSVAIVSEERQVVCTLNTATQGLLLPTLQGRGRIALRIARLDLVGGQYYVNVGAHQRSWDYTYDFHARVYPLAVGHTGGKKGIVFPPHDWELRDAPTAENRVAK